MHTVFHLADELVLCAAFTHVAICSLYVHYWQGIDVKVAN